MREMNRECTQIKIDFSEKLNLIKSTFSLTNEDLAKVLRSGRKTVHNWMSGDDQPSRRKAKRILELDNIANLWAQSGFSTGSSINLVTGRSGYSLMELLSQPNLERDKVIFHGSSMYFDSDLTELKDPFAISRNTVPL
ncbi:hypothetical protein N9L54_05270 [Porticoccaceae bacterium]|nr:hypothetical protein [Porticoccaceae bacterium]